MQKQIREGQAIREGARQKFRPPAVPVFFAHLHGGGPKLLLILAEDKQSWDTNSCPRKSKKLKDARYHGEPWLVTAVQAFV